MYILVCMFVYVYVCIYINIYVQYIIYIIYSYICKFVFIPWSTRSFIEWFLLDRIGVIAQHTVLISLLEQKILDGSMCQGLEERRL